MIWDLDGGSRSGVYKLGIFLTSRNTKKKINKKVQEQKSIIEVGHPGIWHKYLGDGPRDLPAFPMKNPIF